VVVWVGLNLNPHPLKNERVRHPNAFRMPKWVETKKNGEEFLRVVFYVLRIARGMGREAFERSERARKSQMRRELFFLK
jgi:hypothetical protein